MKTGKPRQTFYFLSSPSRSGRRESGWRPNMDVYETEDDVVVALEIPGVKPEDLEVVQYDDRIVVRGVRHPNLSGRPKRFHQIEIPCGRFEKEILLPASLRGSHIEAKLALGMLNVRIARAAPHGKAGEKKIDIEAE